MAQFPVHPVKEGYGMLIFSISLAIFMSSLDGTIVNIALPTISQSYQVSSTIVSWVATGYTLVLAGCVLIFGKLSDTIGFKKIFLEGFAIFTLGSLICGLLPMFFGSVLVLIGSRVVQAVGGAMITAIAPAMITAYIPREQRGRAMGIIMTVAAFGMALGPTIGGVLTQLLSWEWIFFINLPVGILALLLGAKVIPEPAKPREMVSFDRGGALLIFVSLSSLLFVVSEGHTLGWTSATILCPALLAILTFAGFIWHELRVADPLLELRLFSQRNFIIPNTLLSLVFFSFAGINYLLPFYLEYVRQYDTFDSGVILTSLSFAMMGAGILAGMLYNRIGPRNLCIISSISLLGGYYMMTQLRPFTGAGFLIVSLVLIGVGLGLMITPASNIVMTSVARTRQGMVSSLTSLERFVPISMGIAFFNQIFILGILSIATSHGVTEQAPVSIKVEVLSAGFDLTFAFSFFIGIVILILALFLKVETHPDYQEGSGERLDPSASLSL